MCWERWSFQIPPVDFFEILWISSPAASSYSSMSSYEKVARILKMGRRLACFRNPFLGMKKKKKTQKKGPGKFRSGQPWRSEPLHLKRFKGTKLVAPSQIWTFTTRPTQKLELYSVWVSFQLVSQKNPWRQKNKLRKRGTAVITRKGYDIWWLSQKISAGSKALNQTYAERLKANKHARILMFFWTCQFWSEILWWKKMRQMLWHIGSWPTVVEFEQSFCPLTRPVQNKSPNQKLSRKEFRDFIGVETLELAHNSSQCLFFSKSLLAGFISHDWSKWQASPLGHHAPLSLLPLSYARLKLLTTPRRHSPLLGVLIGVHLHRSFSKSNELLLAPKTSPAKNFSSSNVPSGKHGDSPN